MSKHVHYDGEAAVIDEETGVLLQPGLVEVRNHKHADSIVKRGLAKHAKTPTPAEKAASKKKRTAAEKRAADKATKEAAAAVAAASTGAGTTEDQPTGEGEKE